MSKVTIKNTTEHDISFSVKNEEGLLETITILGSRENPENRKEILFEAGLCHEQGLSEAMDKGNDALKALFSLGHLVVIYVGDKAKAKADAEAKAEADAKATAEADAKADADVEAKAKAEAEAKNKKGR